MTMHLAQGLTMLRTTKRKRKPVTDSQLKKYESQMREHNKFLKSLGMHQHTMTLDEYIKYCRGEHKSKVERKHTPDPFGHDQVYQRPTTDIPSSNNIAGIAATKKEPMVYSGERKLLGIATMHKSNQVPVFDDQDAKDIAKMRR